ncbi:VWA domain-containing protein [Thermoflexus sp.]|uniref:VWA domain-containing protein n=1 Tax=Thermoflexus sp. TaxID=1969742 RepID=UPI00261BC981|nr:VWA domain-containing protein [Thermoflexus sp.]MCX7690657.1 VWA domain-containing protein [Thermoflexus sp.]
MSAREEFVDYYAILGVPPSADAEEIKKAYRALARKVHPDVMPGAGTSLLFRLVHEAYSVLSDPERREEYDRRWQARWGSQRSFLRLQLLLSRSALPSLSASQILYALLTIEPARPHAIPRLPLHLCLVIDRSNSMRGERLERVKAAALELTGHLGRGDRLAMVAFHNRAEVIWPLSPVGERHRLSMRLEALTAEGGTEIYKGLLLGFQELFRARQAGVHSHLILLTDGRTYGDEDQCRTLADQAREAGIGISAFGIGEDWNDVLLDEIAARSGGISGYIASPEEIRRRFLEHLSLLQDRYAEDVRLVVEPAEGVLVTALYQITPELRVPLREDSGWYLGALHTSRPIQALVEFALPPLEPGFLEVARLRAQARIPGNPPQLDEAELSVQAHVLPDEPLMTSPPEPVLEALSRVVIYRMQEQAWADVQAGRWVEGAQKLREVGTRLLELGVKDLAQEALAVATRLLQGHSVSRSQRLALKYRTRMLMLPPPELGERP